MPMRTATWACLQPRPLVEVAVQYQEALRLKPDYADCTLE